MNRKEFAKRRKTLMRMVGEDGMAILPSAPVKTRNRDVEYRFRQDSDFYYLSGFAEPDAVAKADFHQAASPKNENEAGDSVSRSTRIFML